jgi:hypothetical protein
MRGETVMLAASINHTVAMYPIQLFSQVMFQYCALNFPYQITRPAKVSLALCTI